MSTYELELTHLTADTRMAIESKESVFMNKAQMQEFSLLLHVGVAHDIEELRAEQRRAIEESKHIALA